ncbi:MAG: PH domain-containing protein [Dehalococcoidia bacterium]
MVLAGGAALVVGLTAARSEPELETAVAWLAAGGLGIAAVLFASWTFCMATLSYRIEAGNLTVRWGLRTMEVALSSVESVTPGRTVDEISVRGINWWGCHVGEAEIRRIGPTLVFATTVEPESLLFVRTDTESYGLTVAAQAEFVEELEAHRHSDAVQPHAQHATASGIAALPIWRDRVALGASRMRTRHRIRVRTIPERGSHHRD